MGGRDRANGNAEALEEGKRFAKEKEGIQRKEG